MSSDEGDLYDELLADSFRLCRRVRVVSYWVSWAAAMMAIAVLVQAALILWPEDVEGGWFMYAPSPDVIETEPAFFGSVEVVGGGGFASSDSFSPFSLRQRVETALGVLPLAIGWAAVVGVGALSLRALSRRLELDLVGAYSDDQ